MQGNNEQRQHNDVREQTGTNQSVATAKMAKNQFDQAGGGYQKHAGIHPTQPMHRTNPSTIGQTPAGAVQAHQMQAKHQMELLQQHQQNVASGIKRPAMTSPATYRPPQALQQRPVMQGQMQTGVARPLARGPMVSAPPKPVEVHNTTSMPSDAGRSAQKPNIQPITAQDRHAFETFKQEYVSQQKYEDQKQMKSLHILRNRQLRRNGAGPRSILEVLHPNTRMSQALAARTNFRPFTLLSFAAQVTKLESLEVAESILDVAQNTSLFASDDSGSRECPIPYIPHPTELASSVGGITVQPESLFNSDSATHIQQGLWQRASQFINGPPHARVEGTIPYQYQGYHNYDRIRVSPYSPQDILMAVCRARMNLQPLQMNTRGNEEQFMGYLREQLENSKTDKRSHSTQTRSVGDAGTIPMECCGEEAISNSLEGVSIVINLVAKHVTRNIVRAALEKAKQDASLIKLDELRAESKSPDVYVPWHRRCRKDKVFTLEMHQIYEVLREGPIRMHEAD